MSNKSGYQKLVILLGLIVLTIATVVETSLGIARSSDRYTEFVSTHSMMRLSIVWAVIVAVFWILVVVAGKKRPD
jgi:ABC-type transport system involved in cytochrome bd biosynthesis fused ATPase/permease subunit